MYSKLIRDIKSAIGNANLPFEVIVDLAAEDAEACELVNERLTQASALLARGLRDEAIESAERRPILLDQFCQLDFPEREKWQEFLLVSDLDPPPRLLVDTARELEAAYDKRIELAPLVKAHRLSALSRASVKERLLCLKRLAKSDPENPLWPADAQTLQQERVREIHSELKSAKAAGNTLVLQTLSKELANHTDLPAAKKLMADANKALQSNRRDDARGTMEGLAVELNHALTEYDVQLGRQLREQWNQLKTDASLGHKEELAISVDEAFAWLDEVDQEDRDSLAFDKAVGQLEQAIDGGSLEVLEKKIYNAEKFDRELPEGLLQRAAERRESLILVSQRKSRLRLGGIAALVLIAIVTTGGLISFYHTQNALSEARARLETFLTEGEFDPGKSYFQKLSSSLRGDSELIRLNDQLVKQSVAEAERSQAFDEAVSKIKLDGPLDIDLDQFLREAQDLASSDDEKSKVEVLKNRLDTERLVRQRDRDSSFLETLATYRQQAKAVEKVADRTAAIGSLNRIAAAVKELMEVHSMRKDGTTGISIAARKNAQTLIQIALQRREQLESASSAKETLLGMRKNLINMGQYGESLLAFADRYPSEENSGEFRQTAKESQYWTQLATWQTTLRRVGGVRLASISKQDAEEIAREVSTAAEMLSIEDIEPQVEQLLTVLKQKSELGKADILAPRLANLFDRSAYSKIYVLQRDAEQFFLVSKPTEGGDFKYFTRDAKEKSKRGKPTDIVKLAPHCDLGVKLKAIIDQREVPADYENLVLKLMAETLSFQAKAISVDPLVQCQYLDQMLLFGEIASPALKDYVTKHRDELSNQAFMKADWKASPVVADDENRRSAIEFLQKVEASLPQAQAMVVDRDKMFKKIHAMARYADLEMAGCLIRVNKQWQASASTNMVEGEKLIVIAPISPTSARLEVVGTYRQGAVVASENQTHLQAGRPFFVDRGKQSISKTRSQ